MKKRILSVLLALVMALSLCTVALADTTFTPTSPDASNNNPRNPVIGAGFVLDNFYYGGLVSGIRAEGHAATNRGQIATDEYKLMFKSGSDLSYATDWIGAINDDEHYYLEVKFHVNYGDTAASAGTTLSTDKNDYKLYVCQYDTNLQQLDPAYPALGIAAESVEVTNSENMTPTGTALFPLTLTTGINYSVNIPLTKNVTKGGSVAAPQATFGLEIKSASDGESGDFATFFDDFIDVTDGFTYTPGTSDYCITVSGPKAVVEAYLKAGFFVHEKAHSDTHWTCDTQCWFVQDHTYHGNDSNTATKITSFKVDNCDTIPAFAESCNGTSTVEHCYNGVTFNNVYTKNAHRVPSSATPTAKVEAPKTFDAGIAVYGVSALLSLTGSAWVVTRRRDR